MNRHDLDTEALRSMLKRAFPPNEADGESDLWPRMRARIEEHRIRVHWFDWVLLAAVGVSLLLFFPQLIPHVAYQL